jgi:hypothetical protein
MSVDDWFKDANKMKESIIWEKLSKIGWTRVRAIDKTWLYYAKAESNNHSNAVHLFCLSDLKNELLLRYESCIYKKEIRSHTLIHGGTFIGQNLAIFIIRFLKSLFNRRGKRNEGHLLLSLRNMQDNNSGGSQINPVEAYRPF